MSANQQLNKINLVHQLRLIEIDREMYKSKCVTLCNEIVRVYIENAILSYQLQTLMNKMSITITNIRTQLDVVRRNLKSLNSMEKSISSNESNILKLKTVCAKKDFEIDLLRFKVSKLNESNRNLMNENARLKLEQSMLENRAANFDNQLKVLTENYIKVRSANEDLMVKNRQLFERLESTRITWL